MCENDQNEINMIRERLGKVLDSGVTEDQACRLYKLYKLLIDKNRVMNLTRITEFDEVIDKHFADSLIILNDLDVKDMGPVIDVGTGGGFPAIPLAIMLPEVNITAVDSVGKKVEFVREAAGTLGLDRVETVHARAEDLARDPAYREKFGLCVSRAVANLSTLTEYCLPFVKVGGCFAAYKSAEADEELQNAGRAMKLLGGKEPHTVRHDQFGMHRNIVYVKKDHHTPGQYPRKAGVPSRKPL